MREKEFFTVNIFAAVSDADFFFQFSLKERVDSIFFRESVNI